MTSRKAVCASAPPRVTRPHAVQTRSASERLKSSAAPAAPRRAAASSALSGSKGAVTENLSGPDHDSNRQPAGDYKFFGNTAAENLHPARLTRSPADRRHIWSDDGNLLPNARERNQECLMTTWNLLAAALSLCLAQFAGAGARAETGDDYRLSGPAVHGNLAIYFVHGKSRSGPVPLTLAEALAKKTIKVRELGEVNELHVENTGAEEIFIQSGDVEKRRQQARVLTAGLLLNPHAAPPLTPPAGHDQVPRC